MRLDAKEDGDMWGRGPVSGRQVEFKYANTCDRLSAAELLLCELEYLRYTTATVLRLIHVTSPTNKKSRGEWP